MARLSGLFEYDGSGMVEAAKGIRERKKSSQLGRLLSDAYNAPEDQRRGMLAQVLLADPEKGLDYLKVLDPKLRSAENGMFAQKVGEDGYIYNFFRDGTKVNTGTKADRQMWMRDHPGMPNPELVGKDGMVRPIGGAPQGGQMPPQYPQQPAPQMPPPSMEWGGEQGPSAGGFRVDPSLPPQIQAEIAAREQAAGSSPRPWTQNTPNPYGPAMPAPQGGGPYRRPSEAEVAGAEASARERAQIDALPERGRIEAENAARKEAATADVTIGNLPTVGTLEAENTRKAEAARQAAQTAGAAPLAIAKKRGEAAAAWPTVKASALSIVSTIDKVLNHPGLEQATGLRAADPRNKIYGSPGYDFNAKMGQVQGKAFLQAFDQLRGAGAITEQEGAAATKAIAVLDTRQGTPQFKAALKQLQAVAVKGMKTYAEIMQMGGQQPQQQPPASGGWGIKVKP